MGVKELEKIALEKLNSGLLDGVVGNDFDTGNYAIVTFRKVIKEGIPQILRLGAGSKYFNNKENVRIPGNVSTQLFESITEKLGFLQKYGWLMDDPDVKAYSAFFKPTK